MQYSGTAIQNAAAQVRELLVAEAARRLDLPAENLRTENGAVIAPDGQRFGYGDLVAGDMLHVQAQPKSKLKDPATYKVMGQPVPRVDIPAKVTGGAAYVQDMRLPGMVHARVVRPPSYGAQLTECDTSAVEKLPGFVKVVRDGNFLAVVAQKEFQAIKAMKVLSAAAKWKETPSLPKQDDLPRVLTGLKSNDSTIFQQSNPSATGQKTIEATYTRPYQAHGSIGPSCAIAQLVDGAMTVWTHTQGVYPDRQGIAEMLKVPPASVRLIHVEGSGCYGHNGADDAAADAALDRAGAAGHAGSRAMDARAGAWLGAVRAGDGHEAEGIARRQRQDRRLEFRRLEQYPFDAAGRRRIDAGGPAHGAAVCGAGAEADSVAGRRRRPQRDPDLQISQCASGAPLHPGDAGSGLRDARRSAPITTYFPSRVSWTNSRAPPAPTRSNSG